MQAKTVQYTSEFMKAFPDGISAAISEVVGTAVPAEYTPVQRAALRKIRRQSDYLRSRPEREFIGQEQLAFLEKAASDDATRWTLVAQTTNLHDTCAAVRHDIA